MPFVPVAALAATVIKFTDFLKTLTNRDWNAALTILVAWAAGTAALFLGSATVWAHGKGFDIGGVTLGDLDGWSKLFAGMNIGSVGAFAFDYKKARDDKDSAKTPPLVPNNDGNL